VSHRVYLSLYSVLFLFRLFRILQKKLLDLLIDFIQRDQSRIVNTYRFSAQPWCCRWTHNVDALCRSGYYQLRQLRPVARSLSTDAAKTLVHAFVSSRLDYCNALLYGVSEGLLLREQSVQNAGARL